MDRQEAAIARLQLQIDALFSKSLFELVLQLRHILEKYNGIILDVKLYLCSFLSYENWYLTDTLSIASLIENVGL